MHSYLIMIYKLELLLFFVCGLASVEAQQMKAVLLDAQTKSPVDNAFVFISNSSVSDLSDQDGQFTIDRKNLESSDVVITHINYESKYISPKSISNEIDTFYLTPQNFELTEVTINRKDPKKRKKWLKRFTKSILGNTDLAKKTKLLNPEAILFVEKNDTLFAQADEYLVLHNEKLAYKIIFLLQDYALTKNDFVEYKGKLHYEDIIEDYKQKDHKKIYKKRNETFLQSSRKFFKEYVLNIHDVKKYHVGLSVLQPDGQFHYVGEIEREKILEPNTEETFFQLKFKRFLRIENRNISLQKNINSRSSGFGSLSKPSEMDMVIQQKGDVKKSESEFAVSYLMSKTNKLIINQEGLIQNPRDIIEYGYWSDLRLANRLPDDFVYIP